MVLVTACSSDESSGDAPTGTTADAAESGGATTTVPSGGQEEAGGLGWQRVSFGFVSAYLLQRGSEVTIVDTGTGSTAEFETGLSSLGASRSNVANVI